MLNDCFTSDRASAELFIVPAGPIAQVAKSARDRCNQAVLVLHRSFAILPDAPFEDWLDNEPFMGMIASIGIGIDLPDHPGLLRLENLRYGKIVVASRDTKPGKAFRSQVLTTLARFMGSLFPNGHVYTVTFSKATQTEFARSVLHPESRRLTQVVQVPGTDA
jgi:DNA gyrase/topoisomerase IV subunit B